MIEALVVVTLLVGSAVWLLVWATRELARRVRARR